MKKLWLFLLIGMCFAGLSAQGTFYYIYDDADFPNPERGFTYPFTIGTGDIAAFDAAEFDWLRQLHLSDRSEGNYSVYSTVISLEFELNDFVESPISNWYLEKMQGIFELARDAGIKIDLQYSYTDGSNNNCFNNNDYFCPPYKDAAKDVVLMHIQQLKPHWVENVDVINNLSLGFIGIYGETYYTDFFGGANVPMQAKSWEDRNEVIQAMLDALPDERMVTIRYPQQIQKFSHGPGASSSAPALAAAEAFSGSDHSRLGFYNDCFLSDYTDVGTYLNFETEEEDTANMRPYAQEFSKYVVVSGETCRDYEPWDNCSNDPENPGMADTEMRRFHWSLLNSAFYNGMNDQWVGHCMEEVKRNLGYRFVLTEATFSLGIAPEQVLNIELKLYNRGYASCYNPRDVEVILRDRQDPQLLYKAKLNADPRLWFAEEGEIVISQSLCVPTGFPSRYYDILLNLPDPDPRLRDRPEYSIRLANKLLWEPETGYNSLQHIITPGSGSSNIPCNGEQSFERFRKFSAENHEHGLQDLESYPNPVSNQLNVSFYAQQAGEIEMNLYSATGVRAFSQSVWVISGENQLQFDFSQQGFTSGLYLLEVKNASSSLSKRLIFD